MLPQEHTGSSLRAKGTPGFWGSCRGGGGCPVPQGWLIPCQKGTKHLQKPSQGSVGNRAWECPCGRCLMSSSEPRSTGWRQGLPGRSWGGRVFTKGRQGRRELVRVKAKKAWKGSEAGFFDQGFKGGGGGGGSLNECKLWVLILLGPHPSSPHSLFTGEGSETRVTVPNCLQQRTNVCLL